MNEFFIYLEDITASPGYLKGWRIFNMTSTAVALGPTLVTLFETMMTTMNEVNRDIKQSYRIKFFS